ncbi:DUF4831 family protein, partial [Bacteroidales bacterium OttesenSCG-928-K03]|nr:DUF4831 family protein [Bacteroidales bacterium OttesenSCG-928-K03]
AQIVVNQYKNDNKDGVVYCLPKKSFVIEVIYSEKQNFPGPYSKFASSLLGIDDAIKSQQKSFNIESVAIHPFSEPDNEAKFTLKAPDPGKVEKDIFLLMNNLGIFCGLTNEKDITADFADLNFGNMTNSKEMPSFNTFSAVSSQFKTIDTAIRIVSFDTSFYKMELYNSKTQDLTLEEKAEEAVEKLMEVRHSRFELLTGYQETPYEAASIKYMDNRLLEIENAYLSLFRGYTNEKYYRHCFVYTPDVNNLNKDVNILCFSKDSGICSGSRQGSGQLTINVAPHADILKIQAPEDSRGIRYRVPVVADVSIKFGDKVLTGGVFALPQLGNTISLDIQKYRQITVDPETGNIKSVKVE